MGRRKCMREFKLNAMKLIMERSMKLGASAIVSRTPRP